LLPPPGRSPSDLIDEYEREYENEYEKNLTNVNKSPFPKENSPKKNEKNKANNIWKPKSNAGLADGLQNGEESKVISSGKSDSKKIPALPIATLQITLQDSDQEDSDYEDEEEEPLHLAYQELNERRLLTRQKQIDIGKNTPGYQSFSAVVPKERRSRGDPQTPNKHQVCSKRSWDGQIRKWRRMLHKYDPEVKADSSNVNAVPMSHSPQVLHQVNGVHE